jgi:hypothetical protein
MSLLKSRKELFFQTKAGARGSFMSFITPMLTRQFSGSIDGFSKERGRVWQTKR